MVHTNDAPHETAFTVSVDYRHGLTTGISAEERTGTIRALANDNATAADFVRPGHIFPLVAKEGGVLVRSGHTEAATDLARLAGLPAVGLLAELVNDDGTVKRLPELAAFAQEHGLKFVSIADLIAHRQRRERLVERVGAFDVDTEIGPARAVAYATPFDDAQHLALLFGDIGDGQNLPVRIHREQVIHDVFGGRGGGQDGNLVSRALRRIQAEGRGVLIYLREGTPGVPVIGLQEQVTTPSPSGQAAGHAEGSEEARKRQWREVGVGAQILRDLGVRSIRLLATRQRQYVGLSGFGIAITGTDIVDG
jgi:3,4-dihydroxy 2-butanone 4-phosphate synthase/GTP cyclohydrolase II